jgi:hypothetical protein
VRVSLHPIPSNRDLSRVGLREDLQGRVRQLSIGQHQLPGQLQASSGRDRNLKAVVRFGDWTLQADSEVKIDTETVQCIPNSRLCDRVSQ